jgi:putative addiction module CopG family antidote
MAHALTEHYEQVINRLLEMGLFANRSEVVRAGLRELEERYLDRRLGRAEPDPRDQAYREESYSAARVSRRRAARKGKAPPSSHV